jgi:hypothetical protein
MLLHFVAGLMNVATMFSALGVLAMLVAAGFFSLRLFLSVLSRTQLGLSPLSIHFLNLHHLQLLQLFELILQLLLWQVNLL